MNLSRTIAGVMNWGVWGAALDTQSMGTLIKECVDAGVTTFDHADIYGGHSTEEEWGRAFEGTGIDRKQIQIITKFGIMMPSDNRPEIKEKHYDYSSEHIVNSVENSLKLLKTDYLDVVLLHRPSPLMKPMVIAEALSSLIQSGKVLHVGVSNFTPSQVDLINSKIPIKANQIEISPTALSCFTDGVLDQCILKNIRPMAWSPMAGGKLFGKLSHPNDLNRRYRLQEVANKYNWELDYMIYLWLHHHPANIHPVTGSSKINRIKTSVKAESESISDAQWFEIYTACLGHEVA